MYYLKVQSSYSWHSHVCVRETLRRIVQFSCGEPLHCSCIVDGSCTLDCCHDLLFCLIHPSILSAVSWAWSGRSVLGPHGNVDFRSPPAGVRWASRWDCSLPTYCWTIWFLQVQWLLAQWNEGIFVICILSASPYLLTLSTNSRDFGRIGSVKDSGIVEIIVVAQK